MKRRSVRAPLPIALILGCLVLTAGPLWAQNENETVGFQSNHAFESGHFGENIDVLNGGLNLSIPIGPNYQVNDRLSYQLILSYASKVWEYSDYSAANVDTVSPANENPMGIGFTVNLGRLVQDAHWRQCSDSFGEEATFCYMRTWSWVTPDGNRHGVWYKEQGGLDDEPRGDEYPLRTTDLTYALVWGPEANCNESTGVGCFTVNTPDGLTYTLGHGVVYADSGTNATRGDNLNFGGWYVTRIEDRSVTPVGGQYPSVTVHYDTRIGFQHIISEITDSQGRRIVFHNCKYDTAGGCLDAPGTAADTNPDGSLNRRAIATYQIDVPTFDPSLTESVTETRASYTFTYAYKTVRRAHPETESPPSPRFNGPLLELVRIDYPPYQHRGGSSETYSIYFGYQSTGTEDRGELICRTLPLPRDPARTCESWRGSQAMFTYDYDYYSYLPVFMSGGGKRISGGETSGPTWKSISMVDRVSGTPTRAVVGKHLVMLAPSGALEEFIWTYDRSVNPGFTNPLTATVTDAYGNDTVYHYRASKPPLVEPTSPDFDGRFPADGLAPEWDDGLNFRVDFYSGTGENRRLLRSEEREYDADQQTFFWNGQNVQQRNKNNNRTQRQTTIYHDDGGVQTSVSNSDWDDFGNWRTKSESGFQVQGTRTTHTEYGGITTGTYLSGVFKYREVHDGHRVLQRTDNAYAPAGGRIILTVTRKIPPPSPGSAQNTTAAPGDVKTTYTYEPTSGNILTKTISSGGDGATADYCIDYAWNLANKGAYLKSKTFRNCATGILLGWKAIDRKRDGNTGLIFSSTDPAEFETIYRYDSMGRITDAEPPLPEYPTRIDYVTIQETTVTRGELSDFEFTRYAYDGLGRLVRQEKRPANPAGGYPYQRTCYDVGNRVTFTTEWLKPGAQSGPNPCDATVFPGTRFDYGNPPDPFGRIQKVTTADGKETTTTYQGLDSTVTVGEVAGLSGTSRPVATRYFRDGWNRLIMVDSPSGERRCGGWGALCTSDSQCAVGLTCDSTGGAQAIYGYDLRDNLRQVELVELRNQRRQSRYFEFDGLGRLYMATNPENRTSVSTEYDALGNIRESIDASGAKVRFEYDAAGRLTRMLMRDQTDTVLAENEYDQGLYARGKLSKSISRSDAGNLLFTKSYDYMSLNGRLFRLTQAFQELTGTYPITFSYDYFGNVGAIQYPAGPGTNGILLTAGYTHLNGIPTAVRDNETFQSLASVTYNAAGAVETLTTGGGGTRTLVQFDERNRPRQIKTGPYDQFTGEFVGAAFYDSGEYGYDGAGNIKRIGASTFGYDAANRLSEAFVSNLGTLRANDGKTYTQCFSYDDFGNMTGKATMENGPLNCQGIAQRDLIFMVTAPNGRNTNRVLSEQFGTLGAVDFEYDAKGNVTRDWQRRYLYDTRNHLTSLSRISDPLTPASVSTEQLRYDYDSEGNRVVKRDLSRELTTFYVRGPDGKLLAEFRRTLIGTYAPEWSQYHVYLAGREVALNENRVPNPPGGLSATTVRNGTISDMHVRWRKSLYEDKVTTYKVYRAVGTNPMALVGQFNTTCAGASDFACFDDLGWPSDTQFKYQVTAVAGTLESYGSDIVLNSGDIVRPSPPTCLTGKAGDGQVSLSWNASPSTDVLGYNVYRDTTTNRISQAMVRRADFVDYGLTNGTTHQYWVSAVDSVGNESDMVVNAGCALSGVFSATPRDYAPPSPPRNVTVTGDCTDGGKATIAWEPDDENDARTYWVYRADLSGRRSSGTDPTTQLPNLFFTETGLDPTQTYYYWVTAEDQEHNESPTSLRVAFAPLRLPSSLLSAPVGKPVTIASDGQVRVRYTRPDASRKAASFALYRKLNATPACDGFELIGQIQSQGRLCTGLMQLCSGSDCPVGTACDEYFWNPNTPMLEFLDGTAPNVVALDYALVARDGNGRESGYSETAMAIPTAPPQNYRECYEIASGTNPEDVNCGGTSFRRLVMKWNPPPGKPYQPISATNADGTLGYLMGYHARRFRKETGGSGFATSDKSSLVEEPLKYFKPGSPPPPGMPSDWNMRCSTGGSSCSPYSGSHTCGNWEACVSMGVCTTATTVTCQTDSECVAGTTCYRACTLDPRHACQGDADCGVGICRPKACGMLSELPCAQDADCPATATCDERYGTGTHGVIATDPYLLAGTGPKATYGEAISSPTGADCVMVSAVYKIYADGNWQTATSAPTPNFDPTKLNSDEGSIIARCRQQSLNVCTTTQVCNPAAEPPPITAAPTMESGGGGRSVTVRWPQPADLTNVGGYYLYVRENASRTGIGSVLMHPYGFRGPQPFVTLTPEQNWYEFTDLSNKGPFGVDLAYQFQVAVFDKQGRASEASPLSPELTVTTIDRPVGLKTVIWTANDAAQGGFPTNKVPNPRDFTGIKLQWKPGSFNNGYRVYRSETPGDLGCALLQPGPSNPPNTLICPDATAYSEVLTTSASSTSSGKDTFFHDQNAKSGQVYYYKVKSIGNPPSFPESQPSLEVQAMALEHASMPLSAPRHLKARAARIAGTQDPGPGIYLRWCPNPPQEGVTAYKIYRSRVSGGPYSFLARIENPMDSVGRLSNCMMGSQKCKICTSGLCPSCGFDVCPDTPPPAGYSVFNSGACTVGPGGDCKIVDLTVTAPAPDSVDSFQMTKIFYYVVTAVRGTQESPYSRENAGWPNYVCPDPSCITPFVQRYDPDNEGDIACDDEVSAIDLPTEPLACMAQVFEQPIDIATETRPAAGSESQVAGALSVVREALEDDLVSAPYRFIGAKKPSGGGGGGAPNPPASGRWLFFHTDHLGNPRVITDAVGTVISTHLYLPFGEERSVPTGPESANNMKFTGHERDDESATGENPDGLDYMVARYYSSSLGRFMAVDPAAISAKVQNPQTWNRYSYALGNPLKNLDATGSLTVDAETFRKYPDASRRVISMIVNNAKEYKAFAQFGQASKSDLDAAFRSCHGPVVRVERMGKNGYVAKNGDLVIDEKIFAYYRDSRTGSVALLESTVKHELTDLLDLRDGKEYMWMGKDAGTLFEETVYGEDIDDLEDGARHEGSVSGASDRGWKYSGDATDQWCGREDDEGTKAGNSAHNATSQSTLWNRNRQTRR
jgi:RHS repeat-associated protein